MALNTSGDTRQSLSKAACRWAHANVIFSPPHLGLSIGQTGWKRLILQEVTCGNGGQMRRDSKCRKLSVSYLPVLTGQYRISGTGQPRATQVLPCTGGVPARREHSGSDCGYPVAE